MGETRYAKNGDTHLAYEVRGQGDRDLVLLQGATLPMDSLDEHPNTARIVRRLESLGRLILFDRRGVGQSDPLGPDDTLSPEEQADDLLAVLDAAGSTRCAIVGFFDAGLPALVLGSRNADRVTALALVHAYARFFQAPDYPAGIPASLSDGFDQVLDGGEGPRDTVAIVAPSHADDSRFRNWFDTAGRRGASPRVAGRIWEAMITPDLRDVVAEVSVPTLVLQRRDDLVTPASQGRYLAERIPGATYVELAGGDHLPYSGNVDEILDEIDRFLGGEGREARVDRVLTTVLFTDIVGSTDRAATLGDRRWRELLDTHDDLIRRALVRFDGRLVKATGDGLMASFDSPGRAVQCAAELRDVLSSAGLTIRAGIHTGEVDKRGDDLGGIAVHIAARVMAEAGPGEIYVSASVPVLLTGSEIAFEDQGTRELKGVPGSWQVFRAAI